MRQLMLIYEYAEIVVLLRKITHKTFIRYDHICANIAVCTVC